jgi:hypothetical protein
MLNAGVYIEDENMMSNPRENVFTSTMQSQEGRRKKKEKARRKKKNPVVDR